MQAHLTKPNRYIKELPGDKRTGYHDQEEGETMHSVCFFTSYKAKRFGDLHVIQHDLWVETIATRYGIC